MVKIYNVHKAIENLTPIVNRGESTPEEVVVAGFEILGRGDFHDAAINLGTFNGDAGWERHSQGDEIVHIVAGETAIQMLVDGERQTIQVSAGDLLVVPQGTWHRLQSEKGSDRPHRHPRGPRRPRLRRRPEDAVSLLSL